MSVDQIEAKLMSLPRDERRAFAHWFYSHENEILELSEEDDDLTPEVKTELDRRSKELDENPSLGVPVTEEWFAELRRRYSNERTNKTSAL